MAIGQNGFLDNTIQHSHTSDAERMEIGFRQDQKCHINNEKYITKQNVHKKTQIRCPFMESLKNKFHSLEKLGTEPILSNVHLMAI